MTPVRYTALLELQCLSLTRKAVWNEWTVRQSRWRHPRTSVKFFTNERKSGRRRQQVAPGQYLQAYQRKEEEKAEKRKEEVEDMKGRDSLEVTILDEVNKCSKLVPKLPLHPQTRGWRPTAHQRIDFVASVSLAP